MNANYLLILSALWFCGCSGSTELVMEKEKEDTGSSTSGSLQVATFGGGCFWCTEAVFELVEGVENVVSGYAGGSIPEPTYEQICTGTTGHAEVIKISFDPSKVSYGSLLDTFGQCHDPTTLNRQGADVGTQYRSVVMYHDEKQKLAAQSWKKKLDKTLVDPVVTEIVPAPTFYPAEDYHQDYFRRNPNQSYCAFVIRPKLEKLKLDEDKN